MPTSLVVPLRQMLPQLLDFSTTPINDLPTILTIDFLIDPSVFSTASAPLTPAASATASAPATPEPSTSATTPPQRIAREYAMYLSTHRLQCLQQRRDKAASVMTSGRHRLCFHCLQFEGVSDDQWIRYNPYRPVMTWHPHREVMKRLMPAEVCFHKDCGKAKLRQKWFDETQGAGYVVIDKRLGEQMVANGAYTKFEIKAKMPEYGKAGTPTKEKNREFNYQEYIKKMWDEGWEVGCEEERNEMTVTLCATNAQDDDDNGEGDSWEGFGEEGTTDEARVGAVQGNPVSRDDHYNIGAMIEESEKKTRKEMDEEITNDIFIAMGDA